MPPAASRTQSSLWDTFNPAQCPVRVLLSHVSLGPLPGRLGAELVEPRERTEGNMGEQHTYRTLRRIKRVPEARLCTRSCSWDSSLTTRGGSPVRESRPPGSVRGASSN